MRVLIPSPLRSYTEGAAEVTAAGSTLEDVLTHLDGCYPGIRFRIIDEQDRIRPHIWFFVGGRMARNIAQPIDPGQEVQIVCAVWSGR